jgi:hypothetical protein
MKPIFLIVILFLFLSPAYSQRAAFRDEKTMEIRVYFNDPAGADELAGLEPEGDIYLHAGYAMLYTTPEETVSIISKGYKVEIIKEDIHAFAENFWLNRDNYHSYDEIISVIDSLSANYPEICKKYSYGTSVEGRELAALKISDNVNADETEPEIMFDGGIHGDEIGGAENLVRFAEFLCDSYGGNPDITGLINDREIWLYIMVNPDGRVNMTRYNSYGVDLNRDYGYMWAGDGASPGYYSQVETRAVRTCLLDNQFVIYTSYHSGTEFLAYPWSFRPDPTPDQLHIHQLAGVYASSSGYADLPYEQGYTGMYPINGSSKDAGYASMGAISWTMEISLDKQPPPSQIQYFYEINEPAMVEMIEYAGYGLGGTVTDAGSGEAVAAMIFVNDFYPSYTDPVNGDYHKYLIEGTYQVRAVANGYQSQTQTATVFSAGYTSLDFSLQPEYSHFAYRVIACQVTNENFADEALTYASLGVPDGINYSLGKWGWIILDMQEDIIDGPADEIIVHEGGTDPEGYTCYASESMDGPWILLGGGTGTSAFDFSQSGLTEARYIKISDGGAGPVSGDNAGFDLDAVQVPEQPQVIFLVADTKISDSDGNNDGRIDAGENFDLLITLHNLGGMALQDGNAWLNIDGQYLSCANQEMTIGYLGPQDSIQLVYEMGCSSFCPTGELLLTVLNIISNNGSYQDSFPLNFTSGIIIEDWETGNLLKFDWSVVGNKPWAIYFSDPYEGAYSARSGNIDDSQVSALEVTMDVIGYDDISFYCKVSSEAGGDFLKFYIDNNLKGEWSGEQSWEYRSYQVKPGIHTFKWSFIKDNIITQGLDAGWIDYIVFPSCNLEGTLKTLANAIPYRLCGTGETQLGAYTLGGSGEYAFAWDPPATLDNPEIQFPVAVPLITTLYSVMVDDGQDSVTSEIEVSLFQIPETPVIYQIGDSLVSSAEEGNLWHNSLGPLAGATGKVFYPETEDVYYTIVTEESGCSSDTSNLVNFIFTDLTEYPVSFISVYPNPVHENLEIRFLQKPVQDISIRIIDNSGKTVNQVLILKADIQEIINVSMKGPGNGLFLLLINDRDGNILVLKKLIKL